jgi:hypothetical protein
MEVSPMHHLHFNHLALLVSAIYQWILGALWYSLFFRKQWVALTGHSSAGRVKGEMPKGTIFAVSSSFVGSLILSFILAHVVIWSGAASWGEGAFIGFICWLGFIVPPAFAEKVYEQRPSKLFAINAGYWLVCLLGSGVLLALWH